MPEDEAPSIAEDTPTEDEGESQEGTPAEPESKDEGSQPADEVNWQERYQNLQPDYTRATQEAARYRQVIDLARQGDPEALELLGLEPADDDTEDEDDFEDEEPITRADFQAWLQQQEDQRAAFEAEEAELDEAETHFRQEIAALEKERGEKLSDEEYSYLADYASVMSDEEGRPAVRDGYARLEKAVETKHKAYLESKKAPKVELGTAGQDKFDPADDDARVGLLAAQLEAGEDTST